MIRTSRPLTNFEQHQLEYSQRKRQEYFDRKERERMLARQLAQVELDVKRKKHSSGKPSTKQPQPKVSRKLQHLRQIGKQRGYQDLRDYYSEEC